MAWVLPECIQCRTILVYEPVDLLHLGIRRMAIDKMANRYWLIHDSSYWCEGEVRDTTVTFNLVFSA